MKRSLNWPALFVLTLLCVVPGLFPAWGEPLSDTGGEIDPYRQAREELQAQQGKMAKSLARLERSGITREMVERARLEAETSRLRLESVDAERKLLTQSVLERRLALQNLEQELVAVAEKGDTEELTRMSEFITGNQEAITRDEAQLVEVRKWLGVYREERILAEAWHDEIKERFQRQQERRQASDFEALSQKLRTEMQARQTQAERLRSELATLSGSSAEVEARRELITVRILDLQERNHLARVRLGLARLKDGLSGFDFLLDSNRVTDDALEAAQRRAVTLEEEAQEGLRLLERKRETVARYQHPVEAPPLPPAVTTTGAVSATGAALVQTAAQPNPSVPAPSPAATPQTPSAFSNAPPALKETDALLNTLLQEFDSAIKEMQEVATRLETRRADLKTALEQNIRHGLFVRLELPDDIQGWTRLAKEFAMVPIVLLQRSWEITQDLLLAIQRSDFKRFATLTLAVLLWLGALMGLRALTAWTLRRARPRQEQNFTRQAATAAMELIHLNLPVLALAGIPLLAAWVIGLSTRTLTILAAALGPLLVAKAVINLARLLLVDPDLPEARRQPRLYRQIFWVTALGGILSAIVLLGNLAFFSEPVRVVSDRLFMLFVLLVLIPLKPIRRMALDKLQARFQRAYWVQVTGLLSLLIPLSVLAAVVLGLAGWLRLAGAVGVALGLFLSVTGGWLIANGLLDDLFQLGKRLAVRHLSQGALLSQSLLTPMERISRILLFLAAWVLLFRLYGWDQESAPVRFLDTVFNSTLFNLGSSGVSLKSFVILGLTIAVLVWVGHWSRQVSYRWLLSGVSDQGVRNSLATFAQYIVVLTGFLMALRYAGVDLTSLAVFAGALGVGIGLGLQSIASNFISGILLLIERPLRNGDYVDISAQQGWVTRIGMRSLTLLTRDNVEVIIPNADVAAKPLVNWTRSDNIIRNITFVGIAYSDDPRLAKRIIEETLKGHPDIMKDPPPRVWLWEFAASSVNFRLQFFTDMKRVSENEVKSQVLQQIWDRFQKEGIHIPFPQQEVYIKELPESGRKKGNAEEKEPT